MKWRNVTQSFNEEELVLSREKEQNRELILAGRSGNNTTMKSVCMNRQPEVAILNMCSPIQCTGLVLLLHHYYIIPMTVGFDI